MLLQSGEQMLRSAYAVLEPEHRPDGVRGPGVLYLTTHRLVFEAPASAGMVRDLLRGRESRIVLASSLHDVRNASVRRPRVGKVWLVIDLGPRRPAFDVLEPDEWIGAIAQAKRALPPPGTMPSPTTIIEREVVRVRCRYCGNLAAEAVGHCPACGASL